VAPGGSGSEFGGIGFFLLWGSGGVWRRGVTVASSEGVELQQPNTQIIPIKNLSEGLRARGAPTEGFSGGCGGERAGGLGGGVGGSPCPRGGSGSAARGGGERVAVSGGRCGGAGVRSRGSGGARDGCVFVGGVAVVGGGVGRDKKKKKNRGVLGD